MHKYIGIILAMLVALRANGGPPLITDDPDTPGKNHWEINIAYEFESGRERVTSDDGLSETTERFFEQAIPLIDVNYGFLEHDQLKLEIPLLRLDPAEGDNELGFGDAAFGYKLRFVDEASAPLSISVYPQVSLPTGDEDRDLGSGDFAFTLPLQLGKHFFDDRLFVYGDVGYHEELAEDEDDGLFFGVAAELDVTERLTIVGEIHHDAPMHDALGHDDTVFNVGFKYALTDKASLLGAVGRSLDPSVDRGADLLLYLGMQFAF